MEDYSTYHDTELLALLRKPNPVRNDVFSAIFKRYSDKLFAYCKYHVNDAKQAEDIFQDTWIEFNRAAKKGKPINNIKSFIISIAYRKICKYRKRNKKYRDLFINISGVELDRFNDSLNLEQRMENDEQVAIVLLAVNQLEEIYRETYVLKKLYEMTCEEIAELLGENHDTIQKRFEKAAEMLKEFLKPYSKELNF